MSDYNDSQSSSSGMCTFVPLLILSVTLIVLFGWQLSNASTQRTQFQNIISNQQAAVDQSQQAQKSLAKLATDLLETAKTDDTAKAIATKFGIQQNGAAAGAAPSATP